MQQRISGQRCCKQMSLVSLFICINTQTWIYISHLSMPSLPWCNLVNLYILDYPRADCAKEDFRSKILQAHVIDHLINVLQDLDSAGIQQSSINAITALVQFGKL
jgi:hypothetical protein